MSGVFYKYYTMCYMYSGNRFPCHVTKNICYSLVILHVLPTTTSMQCVNFGFAYTGKCVGVKKNVFVICDGEYDIRCKL